MSARKKCTRCRQEKGVGEFSKDQSKSDGLRPDCKTCRREYDARWREENREYFARWREENREYFARWHAENKDNPEYQEQARARSARRRARERGLPDDGSGVSDWLSHMEESDVWHCHLCGGAFAAEDEIHWDHRDPVSTGTAGTVLSNMAAAHAVCNISRGNTPLREWHKRVGLPDGVV